MKRVIFLLALSLIGSLAFAQTIGGIDSIPDSQVTPWEVEHPIDYQGIYSLGFSEWEYSLVILYSEDTWVAQIKRGEFNEHATEWIWGYETLQNVRVEGNRFYSDEFNGQFAIYTMEGEEVKGFKRLETEDLHRAYEFGSWSGKLDHHFFGAYPQATTRFLSREELQAFSKSELQLMRNEIFARYGYIFRKGGKMEYHFQEQHWYRPMHKDVNPFLTEIELSNIALIRQIEQSGR